MPHDLSDLERSTQQSEEIDDDRTDLRRSCDLDFRITLLKVRVRVMTCVTPAPPVAFADSHERCKVIVGVVQPAGLERRAVGEFVPTGVAGRIDRAIDQEGGYRPPRAPA